MQKNLITNIFLLILLNFLPVSFYYSQNNNEIISVFKSDKAIERSDELVKEYLAGYYRNVSRLVGRVWLDIYSKLQSIGDVTFYKDYLNELESRNMKKVRMDCTTYCAKLLKAGMRSEDYSKLVKYHSEIWEGLGFAGWSVGHLLVDRFGWKAYTFIEKDAEDYHHYLSHFKVRKEYPVWKQPNIKIEEYFILGEDDAKVEELLSKHKFSWGFSEDGVHTWITNFTDLKECHWGGPPAEKYNPNNSFPLLFETTRFIEFEDYDVHLVVFPTK